MAPPPRTRRFAYYDRLSAKQKATYRASDAIAEVPLTDVAALVPLVRLIEVELATGKRARVALAVTAFVGAVVAQLGASAVKVHVRLVRPDLEDAELHGLYTFASEGKPPKLEVWMRTRANEQVVKFRTFLRTVCHELLHHLDVTVFAMDDSFHTEGFFRRESSLVRTLLGEEKRPRRARPPPVQMSLFETAPKPAGPPRARCDQRSDVQTSGRAHLQEPDQPPPPTSDRQMPVPIAPGVMTRRS